MSEMKAALLYGDRDLRVQQIEKPQAGDNGVLVKVKAVGVCGTDLHAYKMGMFKEMSLPQADGSVLFGHEFAGDVVKIGSDVELDGIQLIADGRVDRKSLVTPTYPLSDAPSAFEAQIKTGETLKAVIHPWRAP